MYRMLLPYSGGEDEAGALHLAARLAARMNGQVGTIFVSNTLLPLSGMEQDGFDHIRATNGLATANEFLAEFYRNQHRAKASGAHKSFNELVAGFEERRRFTWQEQTDVFQEPEALIRKASFLHDLTLCSFSLRSPLLEAVVEYVLLATGRPVLFASKQPVTNSDLTTVIAWKAVPPTVRALTMALPVLRAGSKCHVASIDKGEHSDGPTAAEIAAYLSESGVTAEAHTLIAEKQSPQAVLETFCENIRADILVMGAYSQSRLKQFFFGGFTKHFLTRRSMSLLMAA